VSSTETKPDESHGRPAWREVLNSTGEVVAPKSKWYGVSPAARRRIRRAFRPSYYVLLVGGALIMVVPFLWMTVTSLKTESNVFRYPPEWIPDPVQWQNYSDAMSVAPFARYFLNSLMITSAEVIGGLFISAIAAYVFARLRFPGRDVIFIVVLATMMVPAHVELIPQFIIMRELGWIDTFAAIIVPGLFWPFGIFMLRQFFKSVPQELDDAARMDGAGYLRRLFGLYIPLSIPALAALGIFKFLFSWNSLIMPLILLTSREKYTVTLGLAMFQGQYETRWALLMAATVVSLLPILVVFVIGQRYFVEGVTLSGLKR
jgi:multiple sugar transport system permease protein